MHGFVDGGGLIPPHPSTGDKHGDRVRDEWHALIAKVQLPFRITPWTYYAYAYGLEREVYTRTYLAARPFARTAYRGTLDALIVRRTKLGNSVGSQNGVGH